MGDDKYYEERISEVTTNILIHTVNQDLCCRRIKRMHLLLNCQTRANLDLTVSFVY